MGRRIAECGVGLALLWGTAVSAEAATISWSGASGGSWFVAGNWSPAQVPASADDVVIDANVVVSVPSGSPSISFNTLTLGDAGRSFTPTLKVSAAAATAGLVTVNSGAVFQQDTNSQISFGGVTVLPGGLLTHTANASTRAFLLNLSVSGDFNLQAGASIAVSGLGYAGGGFNGPGYGPGGGSAYNTGIQAGAGGGHGGKGGAAAGNLSGGGVGYDSVTNPTDLGSGGGGGDGSTYGGAGGGAVLLNVGGTLTLNGTINADGGSGGGGGPTRASGGGAGGTVNLTAAALTGSGVLRASGGAGGTANYLGGGGGGGRISILVGSNDSSTLDVQADPGNSPYTGGTGVTARKGPNESNYSLTIGNQTAVPQAVTLLSGSSPTFADITIYT